MRSLSMSNPVYQERADALVQAASGDDPKIMQDAFIQFAECIQQEVIAEAEKLMDINDTAVLAARGIRQLTGTENNYYAKLIDAMRSAYSNGNPQQALNDMDVVMPETIINDVFADLETEHPLLSAIDFQYARGVVRWLMNANPEQLATWSPLCAEILKELSSGFRQLNVEQNKLSAFLPVCKSMLDLGPLWLDRYVRAVLREALYLGLEDGILNGRGQVSTGAINEPIGMRKNLAGSIDPVNGYPDKEKIAFTSLDPINYGNLLSKLAFTENGRTRIVRNVIFVVNPVDYLTKVMPATTVRTTDGGYNRDVFPFPTTVIPSTRIAQNEAIIGLGKRYLMIAGIGKNGVIEYSDQYRFLEDERVYLTKFLGHGQAKDNNAFQLLDITDLQPTVLDVRVVNAADFPDVDAP